VAAGFLVSAVGLGLYYLVAAAAAGKSNDGGD
jgi:hypothetical protein